LGNFLPRNTYNFAQQWNSFYFWTPSLNCNSRF
jgi:hypothetical protein